MGDYVAYIGGTETFGRFIETPYPMLLEDQSGLSSINLGCQNAGVEAFISSPELIDICSMAKVTVIEILGAPNMSNRMYTVDPRNNNRFVRASKSFKDTFPEMDFSKFDRTDDLLNEIACKAPDKVHLVRQEIQSAWVARMRTLLDKIAGRKILLWLADHVPFSAVAGGTICREPLFVDRAMLNAVTSRADRLIEIVATQDEITQGYEFLYHSDLEHAEAKEMLGPVVHARVAEALLPIISENTQAKISQEKVFEKAIA